MIVFLEQPTDAISTTSFHIYGWVANNSAMPVRVTASGVELEVATYPRPDFSKAIPEMWTAGFSAFVQLSQFKATKQLDLAVSSGSARLTRQVAVPDQLYKTAMIEQASRTVRRRWILNNALCCHCKTRLAGVSRCDRCGNEHQRGGVLDFLPGPHPELSFNGAVCSHGYDRDVDRIIAAASERGGMVLDCGAGWRQSSRPTVVTTEIFAYPNTDAVAVGEHLPFEDGVFDAVLSLHVLEHVPNPFTCADELLRVLKPGGVLFAVVPMIVPEHGYPHHYFNPTREGLMQLFGRNKETARVYIPTSGQPINGLQLLLNSYSNDLPERLRARFDKLTIGEIRGRELSSWFSDEVVTGLPLAGQVKIATNFAIEFKKDN